MQPASSKPCIVKLGVDEHFIVLRNSHDTGVYAAGNIGLGFCKLEIADFEIIYITEKMSALKSEIKIVFKGWLSCEVVKGSEPEVATFDASFHQDLSFKVLEVLG